MKKVGWVALAAAMVGCAEPPVAEIRIGVLAADGDMYRQSSGEPTILGARLAAG